MVLYRGCIAKQLGVAPVRNRFREEHSLIGHVEIILTNNQLLNNLVGRTNDHTKTTKGYHNRNLERYTTLSRAFSRLCSQKHVKE